MKKYLYIFFGVILYSCSYGVDFEIENKSNVLIKNISLTNGFNKVTLDSIQDDSKKTIFLDFKKNNTKADGNYGIEYEKNDIKYFNNFGYYSNGMPSNEKMIVLFTADTLIIK